MEPKTNLNQMPYLRLIITAYQDGVSMNKIARAFDTYPTTIKRILEKNEVELRHDAKRKGSLYVTDGEELIKWAKSQGRLVTKEELAKIVGTKRLSPSYFEKYPELGQYIVRPGQKELQKYSQKLYEWLRKNNIPYKPNDKKTIGVCVTASLLGEYKNIVIQLNIKPQCVSKSKHKQMMETKLRKANESKIIIFFIDENYFDNLDELKKLLNSYIGHKGE